MLRIRWCFLCGVLASALASAPASADRRAHDHEAARTAVENGEILSLTDILSGLRGRLPGDIAGVEIERKGGRWIYEFRIVDQNGRLFEAEVDGRSGMIERVKEK